MLAGHFTTAILAKQRVPAGHIAFYLIASQLPDLLWLVFHYLGLEPTQPTNFMVVTLQNMDVDMTYSHDLLPIPFWALLTFLVGRALFGDWRPALAGGMLVVVHAAVDYVGGFEHFVFGPDSQVVAFGLYTSAPYLAVSIELVFIVATMVWIFATDRRLGVQRSRATWTVRWAVMVTGVGFLFVSARHSFADLTGVPPDPALDGTAVPTLAITYWGMLFALLWSESRVPVEPGPASSP